MLSSDALIPKPIKELENLPIFTLFDLNNNPQELQQWQGRILILNFWATWCPPCIAEIPEFIQLQNELGNRGLQFVGIAIDEIKDVKEFVSKTGINYPILIGDHQALQLSEQLGNRLQGLPFSVIFNRDGKVIYRGIGSLTVDTIRATINSLL
jgi:thiol-disulfide isomerase/thioredoxin